MAFDTLCDLPYHWLLLWSAIKKKGSLFFLIFSNPLYDFVPLLSVLNCNYRARKD